MTTELAIPEITGMQKYDDKAFDSMSGSSYLPRLQLMTASSDKCKTGEFPINHYASVSGQSYQDLGSETDILVIAWRPKALKMGDDIVACYDPESEVFRKIQLESEIKDSGCMYGPEFLVYVPAVKKFATFFLGSKSARREGNNVRARTGKAATLKSRLVEWKSYKWQAPECKPCNTPFDLPSTEDIKEQVEKFNNPPQQVVEEVVPGEERAR